MKKNSGITLIELMIVIAIVGILAAVAWPSYQSSVQRGYRAEATGFMLTIVERQERYKGHTASYARSLADLELGSVTSGGRYQIRLTDFNADNTEYSILAVPDPAKAQADDPCKTLKLTSKGERLVTGSATLTKEKCWAK